MTGSSRLNVPSLDQLHDRGGRELLGDGSDVVDGVGPARGAVIQVRVPVALGQKHLLSSHDPDAEPGDPPIDQRHLGQGIDLRGEVAPPTTAPGPTARSRNPRLLLLDPR